MGYRRFASNAPCPNCGTSLVVVKASQGGDWLVCSKCKWEAARRNVRIDEESSPQRVYYLDRCIGTLREV